MKVIFPLQSAYSDSYVNPEWKSGARSSIKKQLPGIMTCVDTETGEWASAGWRSRRTSHTCEITYWGHTPGRDDLYREVVRALVLASILEARKRVEVYNEYPFLDEVIEDAGYKHEGFHPDYTKKFEDVTVYGWVPIFDGIPTLSEETRAIFVVSSAVLDYRQKNVELYQKDTDWYKPSQEKGKTFGQELEEQIEEVEKMSGIELVEEPGWSGNSKKSSLLFSPTIDTTRDYFMLGETRVELDEEA